MVICMVCHSGTTIGKHSTLYAIRTSITGCELPPAVAAVHGPQEPLPAQKPPNLLVKPKSAAGSSSIVESASLEAMSWTQLQGAPPVRSSTGVRKGR